MADDLKAANKHDYVKMLINAARVIPDVKKARLRMKQIAEANPEYAKGNNDEN